MGLRCTRSVRHRCLAAALQLLATAVATAAAVYATSSTFHERYSSAPTLARTLGFDAAVRLIQCVRCSELPALGYMAATDDVGAVVMVPAAVSPM